MTLQELKEAVDCALREHDDDTPVIVSERTLHRIAPINHEKITTEVYTDAMKQAFFLIHIHI